MLKLKREILFFKLLLLFIIIHPFIHSFLAVWLTITKRFFGVRFNHFRFDAFVSCCSLFLPRLMNYSKTKAKIPLDSIIALYIKIALLLLLFWSFLSWCSPLSHRPWIIHWDLWSTGHLQYSDVNLCIFLTHSGGGLSLSSSFSSICRSVLNSPACINWIICFNVLGVFFSFSYFYFLFAQPKITPFKKNKKKPIQDVLNIVSGIIFLYIYIYINLFLL